MKHISHLTSYIFLLASSLILLTSCEYKDLCYDHNHWADVYVAFDWQYAPEAVTKGAAPVIPGMGMTVLFFNEDDPASEPIRYDLPGSEGGTVRLLPGTYRALAYNYNTETILYRSMDFINAMQAYTRESSIGEGTMMSRAEMPRAVGTEQELVILEPDPLWAAVSQPFTVNIGDAPRTITMQPTTRVCEVTVTIHNVPNLQYTSQFGGALTGLSPSVSMASGVPGEGHVTQAFTASVVGESTLEMHVRIFGHCPHAAAGELWPHILTVYAILADGSKWYYNIDVGDQLHNSGSQSGDPADHEQEIQIDLDGLPVPKPIVNGSGFQPTIDGWQGVEIPVEM